MQHLSPICKMYSRVYGERPAIIVVLEKSLQWLQRLWLICNKKSVMERSPHGLKLRGTGALEDKMRPEEK